MNRLGGNIHARTPGMSREKWRDLLVRQNATVNVIMDHPQLAIELKSLLPRCLVISRQNLPGGLMDNVHTWMTPEQFVIHHVWTDTDPQANSGAYDLRGTGVAMYVENETNWSAEHMEWELEVAKLAYEFGIPCVLINGAIGQPEPDIIAGGRLDDLLRWCSSPEHNAYIGLHEGGWDQLDPTDQWDGDTQHGWLSGRFWNIVRRCGELMIPVPQFVMTEWTLDGPNTGLRGIAAYLKYWQDNGIADPEKHLYELIVKAWERIYGTLEDRVIGLCWYSYGYVTAHWMPYDLTLHAPRTMNMLAAHDWGEPVIEPIPEPEPEPPPVEEPEQMQGQYTISGLGERRLNVRATPAGAVVTTVGNGDIVILTGNTDEAVLGSTEYLWQEATIGWFAIVPGLVLTEYVSPAIDIEALQQQVEWLREYVIEWVDDTLGLL